MRPCRLVTLLVLVMLTAGCRARSIDIFPCAEGTSWVYEEDIDSEGFAPELQIVRKSISHVEIDGKPYIVLTCEPEGSLSDHDIYQKTGDKLVRLGGATGDKWLQDITWGKPHQEIVSLKKGQEWTNGNAVFRVAGRQSVTVRAGTFETMVVKMTMSSAHYTDTLYYADGVGLVKQEGDNRIELIEFTPGK